MDRSSHHFLLSKPALVVFPSLVLRGPMFLLQDLPRIYNGQEKARGVNQLLNELDGWYALWLAQWPKCQELH